MGLEDGKSCFPDDSALRELQELKASGNAATRYSANVLQAGFLNGLLEEKAEDQTSSPPNLWILGGSRSFKNTALHLSP